MKVKVLSSLLLLWSNQIHGHEELDNPEARRLQAIVERDAIMQIWRENEVTLQESASGVFYFDDDWESEYVCDLSGVVCDATEGGLIRELELSDAYGSLSTYIGLLKVLQKLTITSTDLSGSLPEELGNLRSLQYLNLENNDLTGSFPAQLSALSSLFYIDLSGNSFSGNIPNDIGNLPVVEFLYLDGNQFTGYLPEAVGNLDSLKELRADNLNLIGSVKNSSATCALRDGKLREFILDCGGDLPEIECECCTSCSNGQRSTTVIQVSSAIQSFISNATEAYANFTSEYLPQFDDDLFTYLSNITTVVSENINMKAQDDNNCTYNNTSFEYFDEFESRRLEYSFDVCSDSLFDLFTIDSSVRLEETDISDSSERPDRSLSRYVITEEAPVSCEETVEGKTCFIVDTEIIVYRHPRYYTRDSSEVLILQPTVEFVNERGEYIGQTEVKIEDPLVEVKLQGVMPTLMNTENIAIYETELVRFLQQEVLTTDIDNFDDPAIYVDKATVLDQQLAGTELTVSTMISGAYLPPPEVDVGEVVAEVIDDEGDDFVSALVASDSEYFSQVTSASAFFDGGDDSSDDGNDLSDGEIAAIVVCSSVAVLIVGALIYRKRTREARTKELNEANKSHFEENVAKGLKFNKRISATFNSMMNKYKGTDGPDKEKEGLGEKVEVNEELESVEVKPRVEVMESPIVEEYIEIPDEEHLVEKSESKEMTKNVSPSTDVVAEEEKEWMSDLEKTLGK